MLNPIAEGASTIAINSTRRSVSAPDPCHFESVDAEMLAVIESDAELARPLAVLFSIPAVAARSAFALIVDMPELGTLDAQAPAVLSGTAPIARQSGKRTARAYLNGGRTDVRQALHMPALVTARLNPRLCSKIQRPYRPRPLPQRSLDQDGYSTHRAKEKIFRLFGHSAIATTFFGVCAALASGLFSQKKQFEI